MKVQGTQNSLFDLKKDQNWRIHTFQFNTKLQQSRQSGTGIERDIHINEIELRIQK